MEKTALQTALDALARRDMTRAEVVARLLSRGFTDQQAEAAADELERMKLVDDARTAGFVVEAARRDPAKGRLSLEGKLARRGVDSAVTRQLMDALDPDQDRLNAKRFVASRTWKNPAQAARALASRGFEEECVLTVIEELFPHD